VLLAGTVVTLQLVSGVHVEAVPCGPPDALTGIGLCTADIAADWFSTSADTALYHDIDSDLEALLEDPRQTAFVGVVQAFGQFLERHRPNTGSVRHRPSTSSD
jgi:hypothetical protein